MKGNVPGPFVRLDPEIRGLVPANIPRGGVTSIKTPAERLKLRANRKSERQRKRANRQ